MPTMWADSAFDPAGHLKLQTMDSGAVEKVQIHHQGCHFSNLYWPCPDTEFNLVDFCIQLLSPALIRDHTIPPRQVQQFRPRLAVHMYSRTRPLIPPRLAANLRSNRIKLDIPHRQPKMPLIQRTRVESPLPKMSAALMKPIDVLRVSKVRSPYGLRTLVEVRQRNDNQWPDSSFRYYCG